MWFLNNICCIFMYSPGPQHYISSTRNCQEADNNTSAHGFPKRWLTNLIQWGKKHLNKRGKPMLTPGKEWKRSIAVGFPHKSAFLQKKKMLLVQSSASASASSLSQHLFLAHQMQDRTDHWIYNIVVRCYWDWLPLHLGWKAGWH